MKKPVRRAARLERTGVPAKVVGVWVNNPVIQLEKRNKDLEVGLRNLLVAVQKSKAAWYVLQEDEAVEAAFMLLAHKEPKS